MRFLIILLIFFFVLSGCEKEEIVPAKETRVISLEKYLHGDTTKSKALVIKKKSRKKRWKIRFKIKQTTQ